MLAGVGASLTSAGVPGALQQSRSAARHPAPDAPAAAVDGGAPHDAAPPPPGLAADPAAAGSTTGQVDLLAVAAEIQAARAAAGPAGRIPSVVLAAYKAAAAALGRSDPGCHLGWPLLAGIGKVESNHAEGGAVTRNGTTITPILGPLLDGAPGVAAIRDTDGGRYDGNRVWDRAVGPMQFIPSSWAVFGRDGNGDGVADPSNVYDAALAAAAYLCHSGGDLRDPAAVRRAVYGYNQSWAYVAIVLAWADVYTRGGVLAVPAVLSSGPVAAGSAPAAVAAAAPRPGPATATPAASPSASPSSSPTASAAASPTATPTAPLSEKPTPAPTPAESPTPTASATPTSSSSPSPSPSPSPTACPTSTTTPTPSPSPTPTPTASPDPCASTGPTDTTTPSPSPSP